MKLFDTVVVVGPAGCGKTRNAERLREFFGCSLVRDEMTGGKEVVRGCLHLGESVPNTIPTGTLVIHFNEALKALRGAPMKLTISHRQNFVNDVMNDMPRPAEKARDAAMADFTKQCHAALPPDVQKVLKKYPKMFMKQAFSVKGWYVGYDIRGNSFGYTNNVYVLTLDGKLPMEPDTSTNKPFIDELTAHKELRARLIDVTGSCGTLAQLKEAFPELIKYMPAELKKTKRDLPVAGGGVVADLCKLGLPVCK